VYGSLMGNYLESGHLEYQEGNGRIMFRWVKVGCEGRRWTELAPDCVHWWALMLVVLNLQVLLL